MNISNDAYYFEALSALGWETLEVQRMKTKGKQMYKVLQGMTPNCLVDLFINIKPAKLHYASVKFFENC